MGALRATRYAVAALLTSVVPDSLLTCDGAQGMSGQPGPDCSADPQPTGGASSPPDPAGGQVLAQELLALFTCISRCLTKSCNAQTAGPDWSLLPADIWCSVFLAASPHAFLATSSWATWCRLVVRGSAACKMLRSALLGLASGPLWRNTGFRSSYAGLDPAQSRGLNRLLARNGLHARQPTIWGGDWAAEDLRSVAASLTGGVDFLVLYRMYDFEEAEGIDTALTGCPQISEIHYEGTVPFFFPSSVTKLCVHCEPDDISPDDIAEQEHARRVLSGLAHLRGLRHLEILIPFWVLSRTQARQLAASHPHLEQLHLTLMPAGGLGRHAVKLLSRLPRTAIHLRVATIAHDSSAAASLSELLEDLHGVRLAELRISSREFRPEHEALLAQCSVSALHLHFGDPEQRLELLPALPAGVLPVYVPLPPEAEANETASRECEYLGSEDESE